MKTVKPRVNTLRPKVRKNKPVERVRGNSLYAVMRKMGPRLCAECKRQGTVGPGHELDHITPLHKGGGNNIENLQWLCRYHHELKTEEDLKNE